MYGILTHHINYIHITTSINQHVQHVNITKVSCFPHWCDFTLYKISTVQCNAAQANMVTQLKM